MPLAGNPAIDSTPGPRERAGGSPERRCRNLRKIVADITGMDKISAKMKAQPLPF